MGFLQVKDMVYRHYNNKFNVLLDRRMKFTLMNGLTGVS